MDGRFVRADPFTGGMKQPPPGVVDAREGPLAPSDFEAILRFLPAFEEPGVIVWDEPPAVEFIEALHAHGWVVAFD